MHAIAPRAARPRTARAVFLRLMIAAVALPALMAGCGDDNTVRPQLPNPDHPLTYVVSSTPFHVLYNLQLAYTNRDSTEYGSLFDDAYAGTTIDDSDPASPYTFSKLAERGHVSALARTTSITSIYLTFPPVLTRETDLGDPPGWATIHMTGVRLEINDSPASLQVDQSESMDFKFSPTTPDSTSPTDTTWKIVRWTEFKAFP